MFYNSTDSSLFTKTIFLKLLCIGFFLFIHIEGNAQDVCSIVGKITNDNGEAVPYTAIYIESLQRSSMANEEGEFQMNLPEGQFELLFQNLSYETKTVPIQLKPGKQEINVVLKSIAYALKEVEVDPSSEDPAYNVIRKSLAMAEYYKKQRESYKAKLYARTSFEVTDLPWLMEKLADEEDIKEMKAGYIVESLVEYSYEKGGKVKERIIAQKTAMKDTNMNGSNFVNLDFYNLGGSGIINPLSRSSFAVYKFEYLASLYDGEQLIHKIRIIPRRNGSDLMKGVIYINDQLWNVNKVDVSFNSNMSEVFYKQIYREVDENVWFPMHHQIEGSVSIIGLKADFRYLATIKEVEVKTDSFINEQIKEKIKIQEKAKYKAEETEEIQEENPAITSVEKKLTKSEIREEKINELIEKDKLTKVESLKLVKLIKKQQAEIEEESDTTESLEIQNWRTVEYDDSARANNDSLWGAERQIPLSEKDQAIYRKTDSIQKVDNGDTIVNKDRSIIGDLFLFDGRIKTKNKAVYFRPNGLIVGIGGYFNTVDGYAITKNLGSFEKNKGKGKYYTFSPTLGYAFSRDRWIGEATFETQYKKESASKILIKGGSVTEDFNGQVAMDPQVNNIASLFFLQNYPKFYQRNYVSIQHRSDIGNNLELSLGVQYNDREELKNNSDQDFSLVGDKEYTSNVPVHSDILPNSPLLKSHQSGIIEANLSYQTKQYFRYSKGKKMKYSSQSPKVTLGYQQGIPDFFDSDVQFSLIKAGIERSFSYRLIDRIYYHVEMGKFLNNNQLYFADYQAFNVNPFEFNFTTENSSFALLPYYGFNSSDYYLEAHTSLRNNFILLKYLPLLNKTNWKEEIGFSYLYTEREQHYYEVSYGLSQILLLLDVKAYASFLDHEYANFGLRVSFYLNGD